MNLINEVGSLVNIRFRHKVKTGEIRVQPMEEFRNVGFVRREENELGTHHQSYHVEGFGQRPKFRIVIGVHVRLKIGRVKKEQDFLASFEILKEFAKVFARDFQST